MIVGPNQKLRTLQWLILLSDPLSGAHISKTLLYPQSFSYIRYNNPLRPDDLSRTYVLALLYKSKATVNFEQPDLLALCDQSSDANFSLGITGYLYFRKGKFLQYLEGDEHVVNALMEQIEKDERHQVTQVIYDEALSQRRFPTWSMRLLSPDGVQLEDALNGRLDLLKLPSLSSGYTEKIWAAMDKLSELRGSA